MTEPPINQEIQTKEETFEGIQDVLLGKVLSGRYKIESIIGHGGFGYVYRATHLSLEIPVAVKVMHSHTKDDAEKLRRFENEAKSLAKIVSSHVVKTMDYGLSPVAFIVMEFVEGETLDKLLANKSLSSGELISIFEQVCSGLSAAHDIGLVHRDLKPSNIMVSRKDNSVSAKILDFGIAKINSDDSEVGSGSKLTLTGEIMGSPAYMSPEQWMARTIDNRSDIYSLGCVMYESFTGKPLFKAANAFDYLNLHINGEFEPFSKSLKSKQQDLLLGLEQVIRKCTEKEPANRYQNMNELIADLQSVAAGKKLRIKKAVRVRRSSVGVLAFVAVLVLAIGALAFNYKLVLASIFESQVKSADSLLRRGKSAEAYDAYKQALFLSSYLPAPNIHYLHALKQLSMLADKNGQFSEAREFEKLRKTACGDFDDQEVTQMLARLSATLDGRGDTRYIVQGCKHAESMSIARHGKNTVQRAKILKVEGSAYRDAGDPLRAERVLNEALAIYEKLDYTEEEPYAHALYALGSALDSQKRHAEAVGLYERAVRIAEEHKSLSVSLMLNNLAMDYYFMGNYEKAVPLTGRAIDLAKLHQAPVVSNMVNNFGVLLQKMKRFPEAVTTMQEALELSKTDGRNHHTSGEDILGNLAAAYEGNGQYKKALDTYKESYEFKESYNPKDPSLTVVKHNIERLKAKLAGSVKN